VSRPIALIGLTEKGYLTLRLSATAPGGHSALPSGQEAIARIARALARLEENPLPASLGGVASPMLDALAPEMPLTRRALLANRWLFAPLLLRALESTPATNALVRTTMAPTMIAGGIKENVLPRAASVTLNFRILPGDTSESVIAHVRATIDDPEITIDRVGDSIDPAPAASINGPGYAALRSAVEVIYPDAAIVPGLTVAGTDTPHYVGLAANNYRFEPLRLAASDLERIHGVDERVAVRDYVDMIRFYIAVMRTAK
jgi:carboxypeptidase PM20D1